MLFFCRHGETMHNRKKIKQGRFPSLLTLKGIDQAKSMAYKILDHESNFENYKLISSPMVRTRHTMQIIQEILGIEDKQVILEELITERDAGDFTNISKKLINENFPEFVEANKKDPLNTKFPNGESQQDVIDRLKKFADSIKNEENLIVVTHGKGPKYLSEYIIGNNTECFEGEMNQNYLCMVKDGKYNMI